MPRSAKTKRRKPPLLESQIEQFRALITTCERVMARRRPGRAVEELDEAAEALIARVFGEASEQGEVYAYAQTGEAALIVNLPEEAQEGGAEDTFRESLQQRKRVLESCVAGLELRRATAARGRGRGRRPSVLAAARVADHMCQDVRSIHHEATLKEAARLLQKWNVGSLLVDDGSRYIGIITDTDLSRKAVGRGLDTNATAVRSCMSKPIVSIEDSEPLGEAIVLMKKKSIRHLAVTEDGTIIGVLSVSDLLRAYEQLAGPFVKGPPQG